LGRAKRRGGRRHNPCAFTEQGVAPWLNSGDRHCVKSFFALITPFIAKDHVGFALVAYSFW
jgi:hypothetical protein